MDNIQSGHNDVRSMSSRENISQPPNKTKFSKEDVRNQVKDLLNGLGTFFYEYGQHKIEELKNVLKNETPDENQLKQSLAFIKTDMIDNKDERLDQGLKFGFVNLEKIQTRGELLSKLKEKKPIITTFLNDLETLKTYEGGLDLELKDFANINSNSTAQWTIQYLFKTKYDDIKLLLNVLLTIIDEIESIEKNAVPNDAGRQSPSSVIELNAGTSSTVSNDNQATIVREVIAGEIQLMPGVSEALDITEGDIDMLNQNFPHSMLRIP